MGRHWRSRAFALCLALAVGVAACSVPDRNDGASGSGSTTSVPDAGAPRADASLTGRVVSRDGTPLVGLPVTVTVGRPGAVADALLTAVFTLGIACVASPGACDAGARVADSSTSDADGRFELTLPKAYLPGFETDEDWVVQVGLPPAEGEATGASSSFELEVNAPVQAAPDLAVWDARPTVTPVDGLLQVGVPEITGGAELTGRSVRFVDERGTTLWEVAGSTVDPRVLEDRSTRLVASAGADVVVRHSEGRTIYHQRLVAPTVAHQGDARPLSRGASCTVADGGLVGCPFTDGDLTTPSPAAGGVTVDLGEPREVGLVIVRGVRSASVDDLVIEASLDGSSWDVMPQRLLEGAEGWSAGPGDGGSELRYLRVGGGDRLEALVEISAFAPTEAERAAGRRGSGDGADDRRAVVAAALAIVVGGAAVGVRRRGRSRPGRPAGSRG